MKTFILKFLILCIMVGSLAYFIIRLEKKEDLKSVWGLMISAKTWLVTMALVCMIVSMLLKAYRYFILVNHTVPTMKFHQFLAPFLVGYGFSVLGPFKTGEIVSVEVNKQSQGVPRTASIAALAIFRTYDLVITILFFLIGIWRTIPRLVGIEYQKALHILFFIITGMTVILVIILFYQRVGWVSTNILVKIVGVFSSRFAEWLYPRINSILENYYTSLRIVAKQGSTAIIALFLSLARWLLEFLAFQFILNSLDISFKYIDSAAIVSITLYVSLLTFVPAGLGTGTLTSQLLLESSGLASDIAAAAVINMTLVGTGLTLISAAISILFLKKQISTTPEESTNCKPK
ncbi:MAG: lysylphosphatidylglycerol synthase transmembrane domain-containing protein [Candidatus Heimdallarchaeaceae archaeon]